MPGANIGSFIGPTGKMWMGADAGAVERIERLAGCMLLRCFITECVWSSSRTYIWQLMDRLMGARGHWQKNGSALNVLLHMQM